MKLKVLQVVLLSCVLIVSRFANAGLIVMGDVNIISSSNVISQSGNQSLFSNILGGDTQVLFNTRNTPDRSFPYSTNLRTYYDGIAGVNTSSTGSSITSALISTYGLLVLDFGFGDSPPPLSTQEAAAVLSFINAGNNVLFFGENLASAGVANYNNILNSIGSSIRFADAKTPGGFEISTEVAPHHLTSGVSSLNFGWASYVTGGTALVKYDGRSIVASEGSFENIAASVPEPSTLAIFALGLIGLAIRRFKV
ncbi:PEP-CTERM sorting domain-containing protein [Paraglaciecola arctica]|uniref:PEP-CTERM sorting domain-containing protein n=1 Tax=Paraglaciecola arctica TaxID=1128911 RepID=UPI0020912BE8|nr:PEP-CTERM sorting domain-containing protein [Paraglaciecola arctica]